MAIDFEKIRTENIREYGEGTRHLAFLGRLYPDRTHFIYELLQNAEDVKATSVKFSLHSDRLEFEHNGRFFNEADVRGICGVGEGTKTEDLTLIGKFGIGFKSVYAITNNPEVHSGKDHFRIEHYVRPYDCEEKTPAKGHDTLFIFPFDREDVEAPMAFDELQESLKNMPTHTILFLRHIKKINIKINGDDCLTLSKQIAAHHSDGTSEVILTNGKFHKDNYLLFSKPVPFSKANLSVEISYQLSKEGTPIRPWNTSLVVFFPTEKPTNLGFLIQGPYRTTPARDNIPAKDEFNKQLIELTAELMVESLVWLRDNSYLNENTYDLLPLDETYFPTGSMFRPFYDKLMRAFSSLNLLITSSMNSTGSAKFCRSQVIAIARSIDLRQLVDATMLRELTDGEVKYWLNGSITEQTKPTFYKYLKEKLNIREWRLEDFMLKVDKAFLNNRDDQWLIKLYKMILTQKIWFSSLKEYRTYQWHSSYNKVPFLSKEIIRLQSGEHVKPYKDIKCMEPSAYISEFDVPGFPIVRTALVDDAEIRSFFDALGYTKPSETEYVIEHILPKLSDTGDEDLGDLHLLIDRATKIIKAWGTANNDQKKLISDRIHGRKWIPAHCFADPEKYYLVDASSCYLKNQETTVFFKGSKDHFYACSELKDENATLLTFGVCDKVKITHIKPYSNGQVNLKDYWGNHERGLNGFDPGADVDGLINAMVSTIKEQDVDRGRFIWNNILVPNKHLIKGKVEFSSRQTFEDSIITEKTSIFGMSLCAAKLIANQERKKNGEKELTIADLPDGYIKDLELAELLGIEIPASDPVSDLAREIGLPREIIQELKNNPELASEITAAISKLLSKSKKKSSTNTSENGFSPEFPNMDIHDPERRAETVSDNIHEALDKTFEKRERSVRTSGRSINKETYLKNFYTNSNDEMVCQLCKKIMPFKKRNGEYYFEAVELLSKELISKESESMYLALCPICAAKYKEYIKLDSNKIQNMIKQIRSSEIEEIAIETDHPETLKFNPPHYLDVRTILTELIDPED